MEESTWYVFGTDPYPQTGFKSNDADDDDGGPFDNSYEYVPKQANEDGHYLLVCYLPSAEYWTVEDGRTSDSDYRFAYVVRYRIDEAY